ncbi:hypothetical protein RRG08_039707 [Elysia crispata]|uniref:Uncharacterized protein n=1 Tax=Elysia crispata TaxID=231223 RepID=A0AAE0YAU4_9GAST|nr:hypothetical protein RRG08_039707 [Elysia crispata]
MESQEDKTSIPQSSSFSPKVTRPKLPPFAGSGPRSGSPRSKTDPGRVEIKAIMEDIMNLKKTDWKTFSRSRTSQSTKGKSVSASTSPTASPRIGSPVSDESRSSLSRDRSRSLKILTDRLKNKNSKHASQDQPKVEDVSGRNDVVVVSRTIELQPASNTSQLPPSPPSLHGASKITSPRKSPDRRSMERMYEQIPETPEETEHEEAEGEGATSSRATSSEESFRSVPECQDEMREKTPDSDASGLRERTPDSDDTNSIRSQEDLFKMKSASEKPAGEDEGIAESGDHATPVISTYIYHPIPRNSKFLQLAATKPPKRFPPERRSGITMVNTRGRLGGDLTGSAPDDQARQRFQRRSDSGKSTAQKSSARFITHPPHMKSSHQEAGPLDTNGFSALKASADADDEQKLHSQVSLADSQFASEMSDDASYQDVVDSAVTDSGVDISDRKNGKSSKQKSKSDPSGDRARDMLDFPQTIEGPQSQSAPLLSKEEIEAMGLEKSLALSDEDAKLRSCSDTALAGQPLADDDGGDEHNLSSGGEEEYHNASEAPSLESDVGASLPPPKASKSEAISAPNTPHGPSPSPGPVLERPTVLLSVPSSSSGSGRKPNIFRSASSASVLQSRKPSGASLRDKEVARKYSITSDETMVNAKSSASLVPDFLPIGDTPNNATSMPAVWNKDRLSSTDSPEREPGFRKVSSFVLIQPISVLCGLCDGIEK